MEANIFTRIVEEAKNDPEKQKLREYKLFQDFVIREAQYKRDCETLGIQYDASLRERMFSFNMLAASQTENTPNLHNMEHKKIIFDIFTDREYPEDTIFIPSMDFDFLPHIFDVINLETILFPDDWKELCKYMDSPTPHWFVAQIEHLKIDEKHSIKIDLRPYDNFESHSIAGNIWDIQSRINAIYTQVGRPITLNPNWVKRFQ